MALNRRGRGAPWTGAPARSLPLLGVTGARVCVSGAFVEMVYDQGKGEKERGALRVEPRARTRIGGSGGSGHARHGQDREGKEGASVVACCGRRGTSTGARGRLEAVEGRGVNGRLLCLALQSASLAGIRGFSARTRVSTCVQWLQEE